MSSSNKTPLLTTNRLPEYSAGQWFSYENASAFDANLAMILVVLFCVVLLALALNTLIRCFFRWSHRRSSLDSPPETSAGKLTSPAPAMVPTLVYSTGLKLAGAEAVCAICLSEFINGERVRVLPRCEHGFHAKCIEGWLAAHSSCPTCRASCLASPSEKNPGCGATLVASENSPEMAPEGSSVV